MPLQTTYMGLTLKNPLIASASPHSKSLDGLRRLEDGGVSAIVLHSLFEEQIVHDQAAFDYLERQGSEQSPESLSFFPGGMDDSLSADRYLEEIRKATECIAVPVIGSLNCVSGTGWLDHARQIEAAGAKGIELNIYQVHPDPTVTSQAIEQQLVEIVRDVKKTVKIPVAVKLSPFFTALAALAKELDAAGADALVLFNRFYQPDIDTRLLEVLPSLELSSPREIRLPLLWISILEGSLKASLGGSTGVESVDEVIKYLLAGAHAVMTTSALLRHGPQYGNTLLEGLSGWMAAHGFDRMEDFRGILSHRSIQNPALYERANYLRVLERYEPRYGA